MDLNNFCLQLSALQPLGGCLPLVSRFPTSTTQLQEIWSVPLHLVLVHLELVPSPLGNHIIRPGSVSVSRFFFTVHCLPKTTSLRSGAGALAAGSDSADLECQAHLTEGSRLAGEGFIKVHIVPCPLACLAFHTSLHIPFGPSCTDVTTNTALSLHSTVQAREASTSSVLVSAGWKGTDSLQRGMRRLWLDWEQVKRFVHTLRLPESLLFSQQTVGLPRVGRVGLATGI